MQSGPRSPSHCSDHGDSSQTGHMGGGEEDSRSWLPAGRLLGRTPVRFKVHRAVLALGLQRTGPEQLLVLARLLPGLPWM